MHGRTLSFTTSQIVGINYQSGQSEWVVPTPRIKPKFASFFGMPANSNRLRFPKSQLDTSKNLPKSAVI